MQPEAPETLRTWNRMQRRAKRNERATRPERVVLEGAGDLVPVQRAPLAPRDNYAPEAAVVRVDPDLNAETSEALRFLLPVLLFLFALPSARGAPPLQHVRVTGAGGRPG